MIEPFREELKRMEQQLEEARLRTTWDADLRPFIYAVDRARRDLANAEREELNRLQKTQNTHETTETIQNRSSNYRRD